MIYLRRVRPLAKELAPRLGEAPSCSSVARGVPGQTSGGGERVGRAVILYFREGAHTLRRQLNLESRYANFLLRVNISRPEPDDDDARDARKAVRCR